MFQLLTILEDNSVETNTYVKQLYGMKIECPSELFLYADEEELHKIQQRIFSAGGSEWLWIGIKRTNNLEELEFCPLILHILYGLAQ